MGKFSNTWSLMGASWQILKNDVKLTMFPLISGICCLIVLASFAIPLLVSGAMDSSTSTTSKNQDAIYYLVLFLFYFCNYLVIIFFSGATIACAVMRMQGGNPTISDGLKAAAARLPYIIGWALISATVGLILRIIEDRSERLGQFVAGLLGIAWTVASFLVIPILIIDKKDPITAITESAGLFKKTWGEQLIGNFSFGLVFFLLAIVGIVPLIWGFMMGSGLGIIVCVGIAILYWISLALIQSTLQSIFQAALYLYARNGQAPAGFSAELLSNAMRQK